MIFVTDRQVGCVKYSETATTTAYRNVAHRTEVDKQWFRERLEKVGMSQAELARAAKLYPSALSNVLNQKRQLKFDEATVIAEILRVELPDLLGALGLPRIKIADPVIYISGEIGSADEVHMFDMKESMELPKHLRDLFKNYDGIVLRVKGHFLAPRYLDGELIGVRLPGRYYELKYADKWEEDAESPELTPVQKNFLEGLVQSRQRQLAQIISEERGEFDPAAYIGREIMVALPGGNLFLKRLQPGSKPNTYLLLSINPSYPPVVDAAVDWVAPIDWHFPR